jgi:enoyl-CoA hydratase/carnithine racemase
MKTIEVARSGGVVTVILNRPAKKNAITTQMWDELLATFHEVGASDDDRALVLTGAGGAFCAGADLWAAGGPPIALAQTKRLLNDSFQRSMSEALAAEGAAQTVNFGTKDTAEAIEAFVAKRKPTFRGR